MHIVLDRGWYAIGWDFIATFAAIEHILSQTGKCSRLKYFLVCQVCVLGPSQGWSYSHRGRGSVHLRPQVATVSGTLHTGNNNGSFINWYWWIVERRGEEGLSIKPVICYQTFPGYPQSSTGDWTSGVWGQNVWNIFYFLIPLAGCPGWSRGTRGSTSARWAPRPSSAPSNTSRSSSPRYLSGLNYHQS